MKILELIFDLSPGGGERLVVDLSNAFASMGDEVVLLTIKDDAVRPEIRQFYRPELKEGVTYVNLGCRDGFSVRTLVRVYRAIKQIRPDVLHIHLEPIVKFCFPAIFLLNGKMKIVQTIHTDFNAGHNSLLYKLIFNTVGKRHRMRWVALSPSNYSDFKAKYPSLCARCIPNGRAPIEPSPLFSQVKEEVDALRLSPSTKVFVHVARCVEVKNQTVMVEAFNAFSKDRDACLMIIGDKYDTPLGESVRSSAGPRISFLGTRTNVGDYLLCSDCFCLASRYEGLPITVIEAILTGTPVVSTPLPGVRDVTREGVNAVFSSSFDRDSFVSALVEAYDHLESYKEGAMGLKDGSSCSIASCAASYRDFFETPTFEKA